MCCQSVAFRWKLLTALVYGAWSCYVAWTRAKEISAWLVGQSGYELTKRAPAGAANKEITGRKRKDTVPLARRYHWSLFFPLLYLREGGRPLSRVCMLSTSRRPMQAKPVLSRGGGGIWATSRDSSWLQWRLSQYPLFPSPPMIEA